eukprot:SAG22_NODE_67_length_22882_cov_25.671553_16_plen_135_part_00
MGQQHSSAANGGGAHAAAAVDESPLGLRSPPPPPSPSPSVESVQGRMELIAALLATQPVEPHVFGVRQLLAVTPKCCGIRRPWQMGKEFLVRCRLGVLQFVPIQILCSGLCVLLERLGEFYRDSFLLWQRPGKG